MESAAVRADSSGGRHRSLPGMISLRMRPFEPVPGWSESTSFQRVSNPLRYPIARQRGAPSNWSGLVRRARSRASSRPGRSGKRVADAIPGVKLRVICDRFPDAFPLPVVPIAWSPETEAQEIAAGHIGISWIPDDLWSRGKCGLKVLQYQAAGLPVVANPVGAHREMVRDGRDGISGDDSQRVGSAPSRLVADARLRQRMGLPGSSASGGRVFGFGMGRDVCDVDDRDFAAPAANSWKIDRQPAGPTGERVSRPRRARTRSMPNIQPDRRLMTLCTPHERTTVAGIGGCRRS